MIALSGCEPNQSLRIEFGPLDHLTKPCDLEDLFFKMREAYKYKAGQ